MCSPGGSALQAIMSDRSTMQHVRARTDFAHLLIGITQQLAASDDPADVLRAQSVSGSAGPTGPNAWAGAHVSPANRAVIIAAAHAALRSQPEP